MGIVRRVRPGKAPAVLSLCLVLLAGARAQDPPSPERQRIDVVAEAIRKTVAVEADLNGLPRLLGSGAIVSPDGEIATCAHVVEALRGRAANLRFTVVTSDGKRRPAKLLGGNRRNDIALLQVDARGLPAFRLREAAPRKEETVMALGYPIGNVGLATLGSQSPPHPSVTLGRVVEPSAALLAPGGGTVRYYPDAVASDVPAFLGNSGGPLIDAEGRLLGLTAAVAGAADRTYAVSAASLARFLPQLRGGNVKGIPPRWRDVPEIGQALWGALAANFSDASPSRPYLLEGIRELPSSTGVVRLWRGETEVGLATVLDSRGWAAASLVSLEPTDALDAAVRQVEKQIPEGVLRNIWNRIRPSPESGPLTAHLADGRSFPAVVMKRSEEHRLVLIRIQLPRGVRLVPIPKRLRGSYPAGSPATAAGPDRPFAAGILSHDRHSVTGALRLPGSLSDLWEVLRTDSLGLRGYDFREAILHDISLPRTGLGSPLLDAGGRAIGVNVFFASRGACYAIRMERVLEALGLEDY